MSAEVEPEDRSGLIDDRDGPTCDRDYSYEDLLCAANQPCDNINNRLKFMLSSSQLNRVPLDTSPASFVGDTAHHEESSQCADLE